MFLETNDRHCLQLSIFNTVKTDESQQYKKSTLIKRYDNYTKKYIDIFNFP